MISINRKAVRAAGGTQSDELAAKIKSVTSSTTIGACFIYDTRSMDSDGGAWRKKCAGLSWFDEDLNTATRGGRREFPSVALIVADNATDETLTIYDLDDPAMPVWMVFNVGGSYPAQYMLGETAWGNIHSVYALNGRLYVGRNLAGMVEIDFANDNANRYSTDGQHRYGSIANRNADSDDVIRDSSAAIVHGTVNDVAATIVEGAEIGALGLPIPAVAVATAGGCSVILANGTVNSSSSTQAFGSVEFGNNNRLLAVRDDASNSFLNITTPAEFHSSSFGGDSFLEEDHSAWSWASYGPPFRGSSPAVAAVNSGLALGSDEALNLYKYNQGNPDESAVAYITSQYTSGYQLGDSRLAVLGGYSSITDRSANGNNLTQTGTIVAAAVATDAELSGYSNFSASNYLSRAYDADFDFGTGDFSVMFWCNLSTSSDTEAIVARYAPNSASPDWLIAKQNDTDKIRFLVDGTNAAITANGIAGRWAQVCVLRRGSTVEIYVDGKLDGSGTNSANLTNTSAVLGIGIIPTSSVSNPLASTSSLSLIRISATAPTPQQVKDIYEAEAPLFRAGAKCLLSQVTHTAVNDLAYDNSSDLLYVGTTSADAGDSVSVYRGLERVDTKDGQDLGWDGASAHYVAAAGGVVGYARTSGTGGLVLDLPSVDLRGDINTADTKLPDDGKLHFSGVTTSNGGDVIGHIPIGENENVTVKAHVTAKGYGSNLGTHYANYVLTEQFYRAAGGDVTSAVAEASIVSQESAAGLDATLGVDTSADTAKITVTGDASDRIVWTASVEVIRDAEKSYER